MMKVYHSSNVKIHVLKVGSHVTPNKEISKCFGLNKPGDVHYCHVFKAKERYYSSTWSPLHNCMILNINAEMVGELDPSQGVEGEDWENYTTAVELVPIEIIEY